MSNIQVATIQHLISHPTSGLANNTLAEVLAYSNTGSYANFGGGLYYYDSTATGSSNPGILIVPSSSVGRWRRVVPPDLDLRSVDILNASPISTRINTLLADSRIKALIIDTISIPLDTTTTVTVPSGKKLIFRNNGKFTGSGTISGAYIESSIYDQCFDPSVAINNLTNRIVSIRWFGAKADGSTDNRAIFIKAIQAPKLVNGTPATIKIPGAESSYVNGTLPYYCSDFVEVNRTCKIEGEGMENTAILFADGKLGLRLRAPGIRLRDLTVLGHSAFQSNGYNSSTAHGVQINGNSCILENVTANFFDGDGFHISNEDGTNSNSCKLTNCTTNVNGRHGFYIQGGDSNACTFIHCSGIGNARWNFYEVGFLGNMHIGHHSATAGTLHSLQKSFLTHNGVNYVALADHVNKEPGVAPDWRSYWAVTNLVATFQLTTWSASTNYYNTGAYYTSWDNANNRSVFIGCYAEPDEYITPGTPSSMVIGGSLGLFSNDNSGTLQNLFGTTTSASIGSVSTRPNSTRIWFDTTNPAYSGLYMVRNDANGQGAGYATTMEIDQGSVYWRWANIHSGAHITIPTQTPSFLGLTNPRYETAFMSLATGMYLRNRTNFNVRLLGTASEAPTSGEWATGDLLLNSGTIHSNVMWKCTAGGTPGTWVAV